MKLPLSLLSVAVLGAAPAHATLVIYEGFTGYTAGAMGAGANLNPNGNTIGLNTGSAYTGNGVGNYTYTGTGLTFGSLQTSGGAATFNSSTAVIAGVTSFSGSISGTIYNSYLVNLTSKGTTAGNGFVSRIADGNSTTGARFHAFADARGTTTTVNAGVGYGGTTTVDASTSLVNGTTYLILSSFTNTGTALSLGTPGVANFYAFTLAQYESLAAATDKQTYLSNLSSNIGTGANQVSAYATETLTSGTFTLNSGSSAHFVSVGDVGTVDELRWGTTLGDVLIPEPSVSALALLGAAFAAGRRRR